MTHNMQPDDLRARYAASRAGKIYEALNHLLKACDLTGESGTEVLFDLLSEAVDELDQSIITRSHEDGLCYDVNALLADGIAAKREGLIIIEVDEPGKKITEYRRHNDKD